MLVPALNDLGLCTANSITNNRWKIVDNSKEYRIFLFSFLFLDDISFSETVKIQTFPKTSKRFLCDKTRHYFED